MADLITGATKLAAVIGDPVRHSLSPQIHNAAYAAAGLDWRLVALPVPDGGAAAALDAMRALSIEGFSVTMPHKELVLPHLDELTEAAQALGAVNCITNTDGHLVGDNTDGEYRAQVMRATDVTNVRRVHSFCRQTNGSVYERGLLFLEVQIVACLRLRCRQQSL